MNPVTIVTADSFFYYVHQQLGFYAKDLMWYFYMNASKDFVYRTSVDGINWRDETTEKTSGGDGSVVFDGGDYVHIARIYGQADVKYRRGKLNSDGTINFDAEQTVIDVAGEQYVGARITLDENGYPWITWNRFDGSNWHPHVCKSSTKDGTWTTDTGFPYQLTAVSNSQWVAVPIALSNGDVYVAYVIFRGGGPTYGKLWDSGTNTWGDEETCTTTIGGVSATVIGNDVYLFGTTPFTRFPASNVLIKYVKRTFGVGWSSETQLYDTGSRSPFFMSVSVDRGTNDIYLFWAHLSKQTTVELLGDGNIYVLRQIGGAWDLTPTAIASGETLFRDSDEEAHCISFSEKQNRMIGLAWKTGVDSPWNLRFSLLTLLPSSLKSNSHTL